MFRFSELFFCGLCRIFTWRVQKLCQQRLGMGSSNEASRWPGRFFSVALGISTCSCQVMMIQYRGQLPVAASFLTSTFTHSVCLPLFFARFVMPPENCAHSEYYWVCHSINIGINFDHLIKRIPRMLITLGLIRLAPLHVVSSWFGVLAFATWTLKFSVVIISSQKRVSSANKRPRLSRCQRLTLYPKVIRNK